VSDLVFAGAGSLAASGGGLLLKGGRPHASSGRMRQYDDYALM